MGEECSEIGGLRLRNPPLKHIDTSKKKRDFDTAAEAAGVVGEDEEEEEPVSPASRMFHEPDFSVYVLAILGCKTLIDPEVLKANLVHTILKHPHFRSIQVEDDTGGMKWVRTTVDMENHVIALHDVGGCGLESRKKFVEDYMFNLSKTKIDISRPMWDLHILNFHDGDAAATNHEEEKGVAIFRAHHSLGDGTSLMSLLLACTRQTANPAAVPTVPNMRKKKTAEAADARWLTRCLVAVWSVLRMMWYTVADVAVFFATSWFLKDTVTPLKGPPGLEFTPRRFVHRTVSLDDIKLIKNAMNATINDVALGMAQAGLSRYLNRKYGGRGKEKDEKATPEKNNLPKKMRLRSTLLINLRPAGIQALADMMMKDSKAQWGNWIGFVLLPFTIALRHDPLDYVRQAKATVDRKKQSLEALVTCYISDTFTKLFGFKAAGALSHRILTGTTFCFSNLVGPMEEISFYGHPITYIAPSSYGQPHALVINFQSYVDKMSIVLSVDEDAIPDADQLCDDIIVSLRLIKDAVIAKGLLKS